MIKVHIDSIRYSEKSDQYVIVLKEDRRNRYLPIWTDRCHGDALLAVLQSDSNEPALKTEDLLKVWTGLENLRVKKLIISALEVDFFHAKLIVKQAKHLFAAVHEVDCYPSVGLKLAVLADAPIFVASEVMEQASTQS